MKALGFSTPGGPEVLEVLDLPDPSPGPGELRIRVHAAAVNPTDLARREGMGSSGPEAPAPPHVPGMDAAGVLAEIGPETQTALSVGDEVMAVVVPTGIRGAYAEQIVVPAESVVRAPAHASRAEASTLPMNGLTAQLALDTLRLAPGSAVAVTGAAGAMGGYTVQLAKLAGLQVVADAAETDEALVAELGADLVLPRGSGFAERIREHFPQGVEAAVDAAMLHEELVPAIQDEGEIITLRGYQGTGDRGVRFTPVLVGKYARAQQKLDALRRSAEAGEVTLRVADTLPKEEAAEAHRRLAAGGVRGRLVLEF